MNDTRRFGITIWNIQVVGLSVEAMAPLFFLAMLAMLALLATWPKLEELSPDPVIKFIVFRAFQITRKKLQHNGSCAFHIHFSLLCQLSELGFAKFQTCASPV